MLILQELDNITTVDKTYLIGFDENNNLLTGEFVNYLPYLPHIKLADHWLRKLTCILEILDSIRSYEATIDLTLTVYREAPVLLEE